MDLHTDPEDKTFLYIMHLETVNMQADITELADAQLVCRWYVDSDNTCSQAITLTSGQSARAGYCAFLVVSFIDPGVRSKDVTLTLSWPDGSDHLAVAFLNLENFSREDVFKTEKVELKNQAGVVAIAELHTAVQQRWTRTGPVVQQFEASFISPDEDAQAEHLNRHILDSSTGAEEEDNTAAEQEASAAEQKAAKERLEAEEAERKRSKERLDAEDEAKKRREAEEKEDEARRRKKREDEEKEKEEKERRRKEEEREKDKEHERQKRDDEEKKERQRKHQQDEDDDRRRRKQEDDEEEEKRRRRRDEEERRERDDLERRRRDDDDRDRQRPGARYSTSSDRKYDEEREHDKRQREEPTRDRGRGKDYDREFERDRGQDKPRTSGAGREAEEKDKRRREEQAEKQRQEERRALERRQWDDDRERLRLDARRERQREVAERERRAQERRREKEATTARIAADTRAPAAGKAEQAVETAAAAVDVRTSKRPSHQGRRDANDSDGSEPLAFDGPAPEVVSAAGRRGQPKAAAKGPPAGQRANSARLAGRAAPAAANAAVPMAVRLEQLRAMSTNQHSPAGLWTATGSEAFADDGSHVDHSAGASGMQAEHSASYPQHRSMSSQVPPAWPTHGGGGQFSARGGEGSRRLSPRVAHRPAPTAEIATQTTAPLASGASPGAAGVLVAALADAASGSFTGLGSAPVAAVEECLLRLLALQRELGDGGAACGDAGPQAGVLADAAAGLAPRMLRVLEAARGVCEVNRQKLQHFCQERDLDVDSIAGGGTGYLQPQLSALDKLHGQYASLVPDTKVRTLAPESLHLAHAGGSYHFGGAPLHFSQQTPRSDRASSSGPRPYRNDAIVASPAAAFDHLRTPQTTMSCASVTGPSYFDPPRRVEGPLDPGGSRPQLPSLRSGGSTPPAAKFRQPTSTMSELSSTRGEYGAAGSAPTSARVELTHAAWSSPRLDHNAGWGAGRGAGRSPRQGSGGLHPGTAIGGPPALSVASTSSAASSPRNHVAQATSPQRPQYAAAATSPAQVPLRAALRQLQSVTDSLVPHGRRSSPARRGAALRNSVTGAHAGAGSPSPDHNSSRRHRSEERAAGGRTAPPEDKYLKILQSLQAKGAAGGGLAASLLEGAGVMAPAVSGASTRRQRAVAKKAAVSSDSDSCSDRSDQWARQRNAARA